MNNIHGIIQSGYQAWVLVATVVVLLILRTLWRKARARDFDREFTLALGIGITWLGGGVITRGWWLYWRAKIDAGEDVSWMYDHPVVLVGILLVIGGAILHIRSFTLGRYGEIPFFLISAATASLFMLALTGFQIL